MERHAMLLAYVERFLALERIQAFRRGPHYMEWPVNNKSAFIGAKPAV